MSLLDRIRANDAELRELILAQSPDKYFSDAYDLLEALAYNSNVESVRLHGTFLGGLSSLTSQQRSNVLCSIARLSSVKKLYVTGCGSGGRVRLRDVAELVENARDLRVLELCNVELLGGEKEFSAFEVSLCRHRKLREFVMADFALVDADLSLVDHLFRVLSLVPTLTVVKLEASLVLNDPHYLDGASVAGLVKARSGTLEELHLSKFLLDHRDVRRIVRAIKKSTALRVLSLKRVGLDNADAAKIAEALLLSSSSDGESGGSSCCCLQELDLSSNDIGDEGCLALAKVLQQNDNGRNNLLSVRLTGNKKIGLKGMGAMADVTNQRHVDPDDSDSTSCCSATTKVHDPFGIQWQQRPQQQLRHHQSQRFLHAQ